MAIYGRRDDKGGIGIDRRNRLNNQIRTTGQTKQQPRDFSLLNNPFPTFGQRNQVNRNLNLQTGTGVPSGPLPADQQTLSQLYGGIRSGFEASTSANIEAARRSAELQQEQLNRQLEQQRADYLKNRQTLQRETFLRGRNLLSNLANRGLATSGLQQLGDIQRTIATGQQMNELSQAFERARQGLTTQQQQVAAGLQQFEAGQRAGLQQQLAGLNLQEREATIRESERLTALVEDAISAAGANATPEQKSFLNRLYAATGSGNIPKLQELLNEFRQEGGEQGSLLEVFGGEGEAKASDLISGITSIEGASLTTGESNQINKFITGSENLKTNSPFLQALSSLPRDQEVSPIVTTKSGYAGLNDDYALEIGGQTFTLNGKELATLIMNGQIKVSPAIAVSILQGKDGRIVGVTGESNTAFRKPYLQWLMQQGFVTSRTSTGKFGGIAGIPSYDISEEITDLIR